MSQVIANGGVYTGQNDANGLPVVMGFVGSGAPPTWTGFRALQPANTSYSGGLAITQPAQVMNIDPTNAGNGSTYYNINGTTLGTTRYVLIAGVWTGG